MDPDKLGFETIETRNGKRCLPEPTAAHRGVGEGRRDCGVPHRDVNQSEQRVSSHSHCVRFVLAMLVSVRHINGAF